LIASGGFDHTVLVWDATSGALLHTILGDTDSVTSVAFSHDSQSILSGSADDSARVWNLQTAPGRILLQGHTDVITSMAISADSKYILTGGNDAKAILWGASDGRPVRTFVGRVLPAFSSGPLSGRAHPVYGVAISPDDRYVYFGGEGLETDLWAVATGQPVQSFSNDQDQTGIAGSAFSPDGKYIVSTSGIDNKAILTDVATGQTVRVFEADVAELASVSFASDGKSILAGGFGGSNGMDTTGTQWDVSTGHILHTYVGVPKLAAEKEEDNVVGNYAVFSPDGKYILLDVGKTARLVNAATGDEIHVYVGHQYNVYHLAISPDDKYVLTSSVDGQSAKLWDLTTGQVLSSFPYLNYADVNFSPDGKYFVIYADSKTPEIVDLAYQGDVEFACSRLFRDLTDDERTKYGVVGTQPSCPQFSTAAAGTATPGSTYTANPLPTQSK
jgi:WD40 repeat protein